MTAKLPKTLSLFHTHNRWVLLLALVPAALAPAQAEEPSLAETLAWMENHLSADFLFSLTKIVQLP